MVGFLVTALIIGLALAALDGYLSLREIEINLKKYLGDVLVARDSAPRELRVHFQAQVVALKTLISKHFKL